MERDWDYEAKTHFSDLPDPASIGRKAGERAVRRLNPVKLDSSAMPILFDPRVATSMVGHLAGAINGSAVARGTSFLKDKLGQMVFAPGIAITDDPLRKRGFRSRWFDMEGVARQTRALIEDGRLTTWLLDCATARQLGMASTGHASRGTSSPPSPAPTNIYLNPGKQTPAELMADIKLGLYVTELIGMGVNGVTGDYSRGAAGFVIRDGQLAEPVSEITIAGNLKEMFPHLTPANDLVLFADLVGFTQIADDHTPEQTVGILREVHQRLGRAVHENSGTLDKYLGDGIMASFGTPQAGQRDASCALLAARAMLREMDISASIVCRC